MASALDAAARAESWPPLFEGSYELRDNPLWQRTVELSGRLVRPDGEPTSTVVRFDEHPSEMHDGMTVYSAWLDTEVPAGEYSLQLEAHRPGTEEHSVRISRLRVRE